MAEPTFDAERWQHVLDLFDRAATLPPLQRVAFLNQQAPDPALRAEVEAMLEADAAPNAVFDAEIDDLAQLMPTDEADTETTLRSTRIGPYRLLRLLGQGGMGAVYLAERDDIDKRVALKLIRSTLASSDIRQRFLLERRVLARLEHTNIARLLDAGTTGEGPGPPVPYFAMEYVEGETITAYCDRKRLSVDERLRLFQDVCRAVQYAHQNLVVHRDLKPSNMLVTAEGDLKLLDFGIAKLIEHNEEATALTKTGMHLMTPAYAAPEQVRGAPVTTAADIYALGVLLYELLTGYRPYAVAGKSPLEAAQVILNTDPRRPSTAVHTANTTEEEAARLLAERSTTAERLGRRLRGDLDVICLKSLEKEPAQRYQSAEQFLEDIQRHLDGQPVMARPPTKAYRLRKFIRRHRLGVATAVIIMLSLVGGLGTALWQATEARRERDRTQQALTKSETVTDFLMKLFEGSLPKTTNADSVTVRDLLERGVARAEALDGQAAVQGQMLFVVGHSYYMLGDYNRATVLLEQALEVQQQAHGPEHPDVATTMNQLGDVYLAQHRLADADSFLHAALTMRQRVLGNEHEEVATSLVSVGYAAFRAGNYEDAETYIRQALDLQRTLLGPEHVAVAVSLNTLGLMFSAREEADSAATLHREALAIYHKRYGEEHSDAALTMNHLAGALRRTEQPEDEEEAEVLFRKTLALRRRLLGNEHPLTAQSANNLGLLLRLREKGEEAEPLIREALALNRKLLGNRHPAVSANLQQLAGLLRDQGRLAEAETPYREALAIDLEAFGPEHPDVAGTKYNLANLLREKGDLTEAETLYRDVLVLDRKQFGKDHPYVGNDLQNLGRILLEQSAYAKAEPLFRDALRIMRNHYDDDHHEVQGLCDDLAELYLQQGKPASNACPFLAATTS